MNEDQRLDQYFQARAGTIDLPPRQAATIAARARQRRHARRSMAAFGVAAAVLVVALAFVANGSHNPSVNTAGVPGSDRGPLTWTSVDVPSGLGWSDNTVAASNGSLYGLSTAPGPAGPTYEPSPAVLYRSTDGQTWNETPLPDGLSATALATSGGHLYAVGTAPAGGGKDVVVATSTDGAANWTQAHIPSPRADLTDRFGNQIYLSRPQIAAGPTGIIATVTVTARPDVEALLAAKGDTATGWQTTAAGVDVFRPVDPSTTGCLSEKMGAAATTVVPDSTTSDTAVARSETCSATPAVIDHSYTWSQLGVDAALQAVLGGEVHVYASADGQTFTEVGHPDAAIEWVQALIGTTDGFRMLGGGALDSTIHQLWSSDGQTWTDAGPDLEGSVQSSGLLAGRPAAVIIGKSGTQLLIASPGGGWTVSDLGAATGIADPGVGLSTASFGPLGLVAAFYSGGVDNDTIIVESPDGQTFTHRRLSDFGTGNWSVAGSSVSADAMIVRLLPAARPDSSTPSTPGPQRLIVGTLKN